MFLANFVLVREAFEHPGLQPTPKHRHVSAKADGISVLPFRRLAGADTAGPASLPAPAEKNPALHGKRTARPAAQAQAMVLRSRAAGSGHAAEQRTRRGYSIIGVGRLRSQTPLVPRRRPAARIAAVREYRATFAVGNREPRARQITLRCELRTAATPLPLRSA